MKKIYLLIGLVVLLIGGYFIFVQKPKDISPNLVPIRIGYNAESVANIPIIVAYKKSYFQKHGVLPKIVLLKSAREVVQALAADQIDMGIGGIANFLQAMAKGAPIRYLTAFASSPSFIFVRPNENLNKISDLNGKTISATLNGINELVFRVALKKENIDVNGIKFTDIPRDYLVAALIEKKVIDAALGSQQDKEIMLKAGAIVLPEWEVKGYTEKSEPRNWITVNTDFLNKQEQAVEGFMEAMVDASRFVNDNPEEAAGFLSKYIQEISDGAIVYSPENIVKQWKNKEIINMIWQDPGITMELVEKAKEIGAIDKELTTQDVYDLRFENKLKAAQKEIYGEKN